MLPKDKPVQCLKQDILANKLVNNCERFLIMQNACIQNILPPVNLQSCVDMGCPVQYKWNDHLDISPSVYCCLSSQEDTFGS